MSDGYLVYLTDSVNTVLTIAGDIEAITKDGLLMVKLSRNQLKNLAEDAVRAALRDERDRYGTK